MQFFTALLSALVLAISTNATPVDVAAEHTDLILITSPGKGEAWPVGSTQLVTWDASLIPESDKTNTGIILLGYHDGESLSEHVNYSEPFE